MSTHVRRTSLALLIALGGVVGVAGTAAAQKVYLNPSNQTANSVTGGGNEAQYALIVANLTEQRLTASGYQPRVDQDFTNAPSNANSWGADIFVSIHSNAGGGHGIETLYKSAADKTLAGFMQSGLLAHLPYQSRGLKVRTDLHVLNATTMVANLVEVVFHDCGTTSGYTGHPPSESAFLRSAAGQAQIADGLAAGVCSYYGAACSPAGPVKGTLRGVVYRAPDLTDRIEGATVTLDGGATVTTPADGSWSFDLDAGTYTVTASMVGFEPGSSTRALVGGDVVWGSIGLSASAAPDDVGIAEPDDIGPSEVAGPSDLDSTDTGVAPDATHDLHTDLAQDTRSFEPRVNTACGCGIATRPTPLWGLIACGGFVLVVVAMRRRQE